MLNYQTNPRQKKSSNFLRVEFEAIELHTLRN